MPDFNLQDEEESLGSLESPGEGELTVSVRKGAKPKKKSSAVAMVIVVILVLVIGAGGAYLLNRLGVIKLWGKKPAPELVQIQEQSSAEQQAVATPIDTGQVAMIEAPPLGESKKVTGKATVKQAKPKAESSAPAVVSRLGEMKGNYTIQVSAWQDASTAEEMAKRLQEAGYPAFVEKRLHKSGAWFTVRVGRYSSRKEAQLAVGSFAEELKSSYWIDRTKGQ